MKKILYFFSLLLLFSCKEEMLQPNVNVDMPFVIEDDVNNPVQHKRFLIYKQYGVPVFFTDTLNKVFVTTNVQGDSIYKHEMLDLNWAYNSIGSVKYKFTYITNKEDQLRALENVEKYLQVSIQSLKPFSIFLVDDFAAEGHTEILSVTDTDPTSQRNTLKTINSYRNMMISQMHRPLSQTLIPRFNLMLINNQVKKAIVGNAYKNHLLEFETFVPATFYYERWNNIGVTEGVNFKPASWRNFDPRKTTYTAADSVIFKELIKGFGQVGFIGFHTTSIWYSPSALIDRNQYIDAIFSYNKQVFERTWGATPLVMKKYEKMREIIINDMDIPLDEIVE